MHIHLDHVVVAVRDLEQAIRDYRDLGFTVMPGGVHSNGATRNALIVFGDGTYIELLALTSAAPAPGLIDFSILVRGDEGLVGYALRTEDIAADSSRLKNAGIAVGEIIPGERRRNDGMLVQWQLMLVEDGFSPFFIQDITVRNLRMPVDAACITHANHAVGLAGIEVVARSLTDTRERYRKILGLGQDQFAGQNIIDLQLETGALFLYESHPESPSSNSEALSALRVVFDHDSGERFPLDKTHGVLEIRPSRPDRQSHPGSGWRCG